MNRLVHGWDEGDGSKVLAALATVAGFVVVISLIVKRSVFKFDLVRRELTWRREGLWGRKGGVVPMAGILKASVYCSSDSEGSTYSVHLSLVGGRTLKLTEYTSSWASGKCGRIARIINELLEADGRAEAEAAAIGVAGREQALAAVRLAAKVRGRER